MCGIVGYIGQRDAAGVLLDGLSRLEYRGYDSAGLAVHYEGRLNLARAQGKLLRLRERLAETPLKGSCGIGHTRWATHGRPSEENAHPHQSGPVVVVHNGIIENHLELRQRLEAQGRLFQSQTDTEIFSHLIHLELDHGHGLAEAVRRSVRQVSGSYALAVTSETDPDLLIAARHQSPLVLGLAEGEGFIASDVPAILSYTRDVVFLEDGDLAELRRDDLRITTLDGEPVERPAKRINWSAAQAEKGGYKHFMLKEIHEQPRAVTDTLRGRVDLAQGRVVLDELAFDHDYLASFSRILILACGTSWHAGLVGKFWLEQFCHIPVEVDWASEYRYRDRVCGDETLVLAISQSGETADTLAAIRRARENGSMVLAICNVLESSIPRASDATLYTHAGPEIGVASTKAFVTQLTVLYLLALYLAQELETLKPDDLADKLKELVHVPQLMQVLLYKADHIRNLSKRFHAARDFLFLGRWINYPIALEGALKLKEISYIHAEGYPAGEMKHGPIALIDENLPVVAIVTKNRIYEKVLSNMQEAQARQGTILAIATEGDEDIWNHADEVLTIPRIDETLEPLLTVLPLQLLAYYVADFKGTDVDQPRNLAKSVTVE